MEERNRLKGVVEELREREKRQGEGEVQGREEELLRVMGSLKHMDEFEDNYNDYEGGITFLHRQLKRATTKL